MRKGWRLKLFLQIKGRRIGLLKGTWRGLRRGRSCKFEAEKVLSSKKKKKVSYCTKPSIRTVTHTDTV